MTIHDGDVAFPHDLDPRNWRLDVDQQSIDLYLTVAQGEPRPLTAEEGTQMLDVIYGWRAAEQRKHMVLMSALDALDPEVAEKLLRTYVDYWASDDDSTED